MKRRPRLDGGEQVKHRTGFKTIRWGGYSVANPPLQGAASLLEPVVVSCADVVILLT